MRLLHGDCIEQMKALPESSVDAVICDPPYALEFMGKKWDSFKKKGGQTRTWCDAESSGVGIAAPRFGTQTPAELLAFEAWTAEWAAEALRVLKPGGHLLAFGGSRTHHRLFAGIESAGFEIRDCLMWLYGSGFPKSHNLTGDRTGWGTALKPAYEPIVMARKPLIGTVAQNVQEHGTGAINIDGCRIGTEERTYDLTMTSGNFETTGGGKNTKSGTATVTGRWPANVVLDEVAGAQLDAQAGTNTGGPSRFYYCAKASKKERDAGLDELPEVTKGSNFGNDGPRPHTKDDYEYKATTRNTHPTVKPVTLMRWLVRLITPPGGTVLDPFAGSGTTGVACVHEGVECILIEREAEYLPIIKARVAHAQKEATQLSLGEAA